MAAVHLLNANCNIFQTNICSKVVNCFQNDLFLFFHIKGFRRFPPKKFYNIHHRADETKFCWVIHSSRTWSFRPCNLMLARLSTTFFASFRDENSTTPSPSRLTCTSTYTTLPNWDQFFVKRYGCKLRLCQSTLESYGSSVTSKKLPNDYKSSQKMISLDKWNISSTSQKLPEKFAIWAK